MQNIDTLVLLPLEIELKSFVAALSKGGQPWQSMSVGRAEVWFFTQLRMACAVGGHGKTQLALRAQHLYENAKLCQRIFCVGTAGALREGLKTGDLVVATATVEHDFNLKFFSRPLPEFVGAPELLSKAKAFAPKDFSLYFEKIASGDEDIVDIQRAQELAKKTGAVAVAWEGAGLGRVARFNEVPHLEIRSISDFADTNALGEFKSNLAVCMDHAAQLVEHLIK